MTGPLGTMLLSLLAAVGFDRRLEWEVNGLPDTPASDVVLLRYPYAVAKNHSLGPTAPTELIRFLNYRKPPFLGTGFPWVVVGGVEQPTICYNAHETATVGRWLAVRNRQGECQLIDTSDGHWEKLETDLDDVNAHLASVGVPPVADADFRTFEELAEERKWRGVTQACGGLAAIAVGWGVVAGLVFWLGRRAG